ncbi:hypothetical protein FXB41_28620 [Bradyrhizobium canariense]|uniref:hypothetical protein n=1 Tax=Bradyrhizobium canariense TaxID=255045 RepID=UPI001CA48C5E|nr:hypothetical protein [Bradyrhizobium canariense]MBW5438584.1 hypothetical protein [Bradyrhizobium canariense]
MKPLIVILPIFVAAAGCIPSERVHADTLRWICRYDAMASPTGVQRENFKLEFALDTLTKRAVLIGNAGVSDVGFFNGDQAIRLKRSWVLGQFKRPRSVTATVSRYTADILY